MDNSQGHKKSKEIVINKDSLPTLFCFLLFFGLVILGFFFNKVKAENKHLYTEIHDKEQIITDLTNKVTDTEKAKFDVEKQKNETELKLNQTETEKNTIQKKVEASEKNVQATQKELSQTNQKLTKTSEEKETCYLAAGYLADIAGDLETIFLGIDGAYTDYIKYVHESYTFEDVDEINYQFKVLTNRINSYNAQYQEIIDDLNNN